MIGSPGSRPSFLLMKTHTPLEDSDNNNTTTLSPTRGEESHPTTTPTSIPQ